MTELLFNLISAKKNYDNAEEEYKQKIEEFFYETIDNISVNFNYNKLYLSFHCWQEIPPKMMLDFVNKFGYLAPTVEYKELSDWLIIRHYKFIKILG